MFVRVGIAGLVGIFVLLLVLAAAVLALALTWDPSQSGLGFLALWKNELMTLLNLPVDRAPANRGSDIAQVVAIAGGFVAVILPALYIGAIVFRFFVHPKVFVFRGKIALQKSPSTFVGELDGGGHVLAIRTYNASKRGSPTRTGRWRTGTFPTPSSFA